MTDSKIKVLIVEDEGIIAMDEKLKLIDLGYEVTAIACSFATTLAEITKRMPDFVLMDINIKGKINGIETALYLQEYFNIPSLFISAYTDTETIEKISKLQSMGITSKPLDDSEFQRMMQNFHLPEYRLVSV